MFSTLLVCSLMLEVRRPCQLHVMTIIVRVTLLIEPVFVSVLTGILHGAGLWQFPKQLYLPSVEKSAQAPNSHLKYVWYEPAGSFLLCFCPALHEKWDVFLRLLFLDFLQDLLFCLSSFTAVLFKKKARRLHYPPEIPHMVASHPTLSSSNHAGFYEPKL